MNFQNILRRSTTVTFLLLIGRYRSCIVDCFGFAVYNNCLSLDLQVYSLRHVPRFRRWAFGRKYDQTFAPSALRFGL